MTIINAALLSYGMSGKVFHAPFLQLHPGFRLAGAWERSKQLIQADYPDVISYPAMEAVLADETVQLVVVNTPTYTHYEYAKAALLAGKHIIVEKAFTTTVAEAEELKALAEEKGLVIAVYQNRRWDSDFMTVKKVLREGWLGELSEAEFLYARYRTGKGAKAHFETPGPGAGLLKDLGPHLIDQALSVFGMPQAVFADVRTVRPVSDVDDYFEILLYYPKLRVRLKASFLMRAAGVGYTLQGVNGSFLKSRADMQEKLLLEGNKPNTDDWYTEPESEYGYLKTTYNGEEIEKQIPSEKGNYYHYFDGVYQAIVNGTPSPVSALDGINSMRIIEAAIESAAEGKVVKV